MSNGPIYNVMINYLPGALPVYCNDLSTPLLTVNLNLGTLLNLQNGREAFAAIPTSPNRRRCYALAARLC